MIVLSVACCMVLTVAILECVIPAIMDFEGLLNNLFIYLSLGYILIDNDGPLSLLPTSTAPIWMEYGLGIGSLSVTPRSARGNIFKERRL